LLAVVEVKFNASVEEVVDNTHFINHFVKAAVGHVRKLLSKYFIKVWKIRVGSCDVNALDSRIVCDQGSLFVELHAFPEEACVEVNKRLKNRFVRSFLANGF
jgi:hypothetical protein